MDHSEFLTIENSSFPAPYPFQLEYSSPARGVWNIVHTGMLIPECHQIYVCAKGCLRGVVLTAAEMGEMGRYSALEIQEKYVITGHIEEFMIRGVADIIGKLPYRPKAILLFINCQHFFLAYDQQYVFRKLREQHPDIDFADCYMIPTLRKSGMSPDRKMRIQLYSMLKPRPRDERRINLVGSNHSLVPSTELYELLEQRNYRVTALNHCTSYEDYLNLAAGRLNIYYEPQAENAAMDMEKRLGIPSIYMKNSFDGREIREGYERLFDLLGVSFDRQLLADKEAEANQALASAKALIGDTPISIDYTMTFMVLSLAKRLLTEGFRVKRIYADVFMPEEKADFEWLQNNYPDLEILPTSRPRMRKPIDAIEGVLALGPKAAYFERTAHFVDVTEGGGFFGFDGISRIVEKMIDAYQQEKNTKDVIEKKGYGCLSIVGKDPEEYAEMASQLSNLSATGNGESASLIPTYSSDEFGVCSALYDLGGMVVMHDASGCNSTYTTHDEPRWYDSDSLVYISAVSERESILGDDHKLEKDIEDAANDMKPAFIGLVGAPIPYMTGTDLKGIAKVLETGRNQICMGFPTNGMRDYVYGISLALEAIVDRYCLSAEDSDPDSAIKINLIGMTPMDYHESDDIYKLRKWAKNNGFEVVCSIGMNGNLEEIAHAGDADISLVLSSGGIRAARLLESRFGVPYVISAPFGAFGERIADAIKQIVYDSDESYRDDTNTGSKSRNNKENKDLFAAMKPGQNILIIGEYVTSISLARKLELEKGVKTRVITPVETDKDIVRPGDLIISGEDALISELKKYTPGQLDGIVADPFYKVISPEECKFYSLPHRAFSGRIFDHVKISNLW